MVRHRTVLRELLQNAADAAATKVTIKFETVPSPSVPVPQSNEPYAALKHTLLNHSLKRLLVTNNGQPFGTNDWARLKRIAEGNPDETKIGAFGVGFYSVFADCEEPFVSSGKEAMAFYWKENSLFTRRLRLPETHASAETCFVLDYRNTSSPVPGLLPLCQFLASSLTFVGLEIIELWLDDWNLLKLSKKCAPGVEVALPKELETKTSDRLMRITSVSMETAQLDAEWLNVVGWKPTPTSNAGSGFDSTVAAKGTAPTTSLRSFFSRLTAGPLSAAAQKAAHDERASQLAILENLTGIAKASVFFRVSTAAIRTSIIDVFSQELERATKKPPPKTTKLAILTSSYESTVPGVSSTATDIFSSVLPSRSGRIFIGFPTHQTTGLGAHISAPSVIPTVERESIDLNARWIREWNTSMLRIAGIVCRIAWTGEMQLIKDKLSRTCTAAGRTKLNQDDISGVLPEAIHALNQLTFRESTPSGQVGHIVEEAFWDCSKNATIDILSSRGILSSQQVRIATEDLSFVDGIPVLPRSLVENAKPIVDKLTSFGIITEITVSDIKKELEAKALTGTQLGEFLKWLGPKARSNEVDQATIRSLFGVTVANNDEDENNGQTCVLILSDMKHFINPSRIPTDLPVPLSTIPFKYTKSLSKLQLEALGWEDLQIVPWLRWLVKAGTDRNQLPIEKDMASSPAFAVSVLQTLSRQWDGLSPSSKSSVVDLLSSRTVMPTKLGMSLPGACYFPVVKLFDDLPVLVSLPGVKEKVLVALGVRKTIDVSVIFERLLNVSDNQEKTVESKWSHVDLIRYLASVREDIPANDIKGLRETPICLAEEGTDIKHGSIRRYRVSDLFEPKDALRGLGLPILQWHGLYRPASPEGKLLSSLGLRVKPTVPELVDIMARSVTEGNIALRDRALTYFIANHHTNGYEKFDFTTITTPYLPLQGTDLKRLVTPSQCFTNERATILGFELLRNDLHPHAPKFGVQRDPPMVECILRLLKSPPLTRKDAKVMFGYFASRLGEIKDEHVHRLGDAKFVPISPKIPTLNGIQEKVTVARYISPRECFLGDSDTYGEIFTFVDFGLDGNSFLLRCGSKHEPNKLELAHMTVREPARVLGVLQTPAKYLSLLRSLAENFTTMKRDKELFSQMKRSPFLLASREVPSKAAKIGTNVQDSIGGFEEDDEDERESVQTWQLARASEIIIVDDVITYNHFQASLIVAPQEETLEEFYLALGSPLLSSLVEQQPRVGAVVMDQSSAMKLQKRVMERSRLFLSEFSREAIKHDTKWFEKNLTVHAVDRISLRRVLKVSGQTLSHSQPKTAIVIQDKRKGWILFNTAGGYDFYEVSQALAPLFLTRPKTQSIMVLEMLLNTTLEKLKSRGYNVDRISRQKAAEARIAEDQRQKQLEYERQQSVQRENYQRENYWDGMQERIDPKGFEAIQSPNPSMPGVFPESPESKPGQANGTEKSPRRPKGLFSEITRRLGFDDANRSLQQIQNGSNSSQQSLMPPPYSESDPQHKVRHNHPQTAITPHELTENLTSAIEASRAHNSSTLFSRPRTKEVSETKTYCDDTPGQNIVQIGTSSHGIKIFISKTLPLDRDTFLRANMSALDAFAAVLIDIGQVFRLHPSSLHIFHDEGGGTIAFNRAGSIFLNYRYFENLHLPEVQRGVRGDALSYWWVVVCHELAHNLVEDHGSNHSYYTYVQPFLFFLSWMVLGGVHANRMSQGGLRGALLPGYGGENWGRGKSRWC